MQKGYEFGIMVHDTNKRGMNDEDIITSKIKEWIHLIPERNVYKLDEAVHLHCLELPKFKTNVVGLYIRRPLNRAEASKNALIARLLKRASQKYPTTKALNIALDLLFGSTLMTDIMKYGESQIIELVIQFPNKKHIPEKDIFKKALVLMKELLFAPLIDEEGFNETLFNEEKYLLEQEIKGRVNDKMQYSMERCIESMCSDEAYQIHKYGDLDQLMEIRRKDLLEHLHKILKESQIDIVAIGDIDSKEVASYTQEIFKFERSEVIAIPRETVKRNVAEVNYVQEEFDIRQGKLNLGFRSNIAYEEPLYHAALMFSYVLGGGANSKLFRNVREKESLCYYVFARLEKFKSLMLVGSGIEVENYEKALSLILDEFENMKKGLFTEEELQLAKLTLERSLRSVNDSQHSYMGYYYSQWLSSKVFDIEELVEKVNAVTREQVIEAGQFVELDTVHFLTSRKETLS